MLRAGTDEGRMLEDVLDRLAQGFGDPETAHAVGPQFTCSEANRIAWVLVASRHDEAAVVWLEAHAAGDTNADRHGGSGFDARRYITGRRPPS
jgi:hypothetical protein